jgi:lysophospholipase L1-like esterase
MRVGEIELRERLQGSDDEAVYATLAAHFEPFSERTGFIQRWRPRPELEVDPDERLPREGLPERLLGLANYAQRAWRTHRFRRHRDEAPHLPVVVCEGDSWVAHPLIEDITDHLLDDERYPLLALGVGAAADLLDRMNAARDHEQAIVQHGAKALLLSGGGNDLMLAFSRFLQSWTAGADPQRLLTDAVDTEMQALMGIMRQILAPLEGRVPVVVHGYDYLRVRPRGRGGHFGPFFDRVGIDDPSERFTVLREIVDRYNRHLCEATRDLPWVTYVDLRGTVVDPMEWDDDIHPTEAGFGRVTERIAQALLDRIG